MYKSLHHTFDIQLAEKYGLEEAILIHHFQHWIQVNQKLKRNFFDGRTWTYQTREEIAAHFPYFTYKQVRKITDSLVKQGVLRKGAYNKKGFDKTLWYAFENEEMFTIAQMGNGAAQMGNGAAQMGKPIPDTKTNTEPDTEANIEETKKETALPSPPDGGGGAKAPSLSDSSSSEKKRYGEDGLVRLTDKKYANLKEKYGEDRLKDLIEDLNDYLARKGIDPNKGCHAASIRTFARRQERDREKGGAKRYQTQTKEIDRRRDPERYVGELGE